MITTGVLIWLVLAAGALAAGDANQLRCPEENEASPGFRSYLPDCRAYELVTPAFKGGAEPAILAISADGSRIIAQSLGAFAGSQSDTETHGGEYEFSRSGSGWIVSALSPPASSFPAQTLVAASPELDDTLWLARSPSESIAAENFYVRDGDGAMVEIGPAFPPSLTAGPPAEENQGFEYSLVFKYLDASSEFSHIFFDLQKVHEVGSAWPGDTSIGERSLYEYSGRAARPELVGVNNEGRLISVCGTNLGARLESEMYNAVSANGEAVFFTSDACAEHPGEPLVDEVYARLDGVETVSVSEPTPAQCAACKTPAGPGEGRAAAQFVGASQDGSKAFFLTEQELLPGAKGMNLYEYDFDQPAGEHVIQASSGSPEAEVQGVARVSEDGSHVYFVARGRLTSGPREGRGVTCLSELSSGEVAKEKVAEGEEANDEPVTTGARCRPRQGGDNLYVFQRDAAYPDGRVAFIATLTVGDAEEWGPIDQHKVQATPDGRFLVFESAADLTAGDASSLPQVFEYDAQSEALVRVSRGSDGYEPQGDESANANESAISPQYYRESRVSPAQPGTKLAVTADGAGVLFTSHAALTEEAVPASEAPLETSYGNAYLYRDAVAEGGSIRQGDVYLVSDGRAAPRTVAEGLDASGDDVFFRTQDSLVPQDIDTQFDLYDARADGGFPAPDPPAGCEGCGGMFAPPTVVSAHQGSSVVSEPTAAPPSLVASPRAPAAQTTRARALARALRHCAADRSRRRRLGCEATVYKKYGVKASKKTKVMALAARGVSK
jgi:hypothetical protein